MPYKDPADKRAWNRRDYAKRPQDYKKWRDGSHARARAKRPKCACGCGQTPRTAWGKVRYCLGHAPPGRGALPGAIRSPAATKRITLKALAWAAGFLEGEGSFSQRYNRVTASQVNREPLDLLAALFGGTVRLRKDRTERNWIQQPIHQWDVCGVRGRGVMLTLYMFMSARRQAQIRNGLRVLSA